MWGIFSPPKLAAFFLSSMFVVVLFMLGLFIGSDQMTIIEWELVLMGSLSFSFSVLLDKLGLIFSLVVLLISLSVMLFTVSYMSGDSYLKYFVYMVLLFVMSMNFLVFFPNMIVLLLGWDGLGLTSYLLVIYYLNEKSLSAGMLTAMSNRIGDALLILCGSSCFLIGHWNFSFCQFGSFWFIFLVVVLAAMTKSAQIPFSAWLPAAMAAPTPVSALVHSSTLVTAGVYLIVRFYWTLSGYVYFSGVIFFVGVLTCLMASMSATFEVDLKKIIALSTLSQLGVMMMALGLNQPYLAFFHLVTHALFKALLFICAGTVIHSNLNNQDIRLMGNIWSSMPLTCMMMNIGNLSLCGFPFMAGFYSKDAMTETFMMSSMGVVISVLMLLSISLTSAYTLRLSLMTLWSPFKGSSVLVLGDMSKLVCLSYCLLVGGAIGSGAFMFWFGVPVISVMIMPTLMKVGVLLSILMMGVFIVLLSMNDVLMLFQHFMGTMWFLTYVSSSPLNNQAMNVGQVLVYNEFTWMELLGGKGLLGIFSSLVKIVQSSFNLSISHMMSLFSVVLLLLCLFY